MFDGTGEVASVETVERIAERGPVNVRTDDFVVLGRREFREWGCVGELAFHMGCEVVRDSAGTRECCERREFVGGGEDDRPAATERVV
jgi:hypothetical protein